MIKTLFALILFILGFVFFVIPLMMMAAPGVLLIVAIWLLFRWLDKASATPP